MVNNFDISILTTLEPTPWAIKVRTRMQVIQLQLPLLTKGYYHSGRSILPTTREFIRHPCMYLVANGYELVLKNYLDEEDRERRLFEFEYVQRCVLVEKSAVLIGKEFVNVSEIQKALAFYKAHHDEC